MKAGEGYFQYAKDKTYLKLYPESILNLDDLRNKKILEIGAGHGNDLLYLRNLGFSPDNLFYLDSDHEAHSFALDRLSKNGFPECHILHRDASDNCIPESSFDIVYANNVIHCLGDFYNILKVVGESERVLVDGGFFIGRTLSRKRYHEKLEALGENDFLRYTVQLLDEGKLIGLEPNELEKIVEYAGFSGFKYELEESTWKPVRNIYFCAEKR